MKIQANSLQRSFRRGTTKSRFGSLRQELEQDSQESGRRLGEVTPVEGNGREGSELGSVDR